MLVIVGHSHAGRDKHISNDGRRPSTEKSSMASTLTVDSQHLYTLKTQNFEK